MPDRVKIAQIADMLPVTLVGLLSRAIGRAAEAAGWRDVTIGDASQIYAVPPAPGAPREFHVIEVGPSRVHKAMVSWCCSCGHDGGAYSYGDVGGAVLVAVRHVPNRERWVIEPTEELLGRARRR